MSQSVSDLMRPCRAAVQSTATPAEAALAMLSERVRELPVIDACGKLLGVVRAEDLFGIREETVKPAIRPVRLVVPADALPVDAVRMMQKVGSDQAVVVDGEKVVGLFAWQDAVERLAD